MSEVVKFKISKTKKLPTIARKINKIGAYVEREWKNVHSLFIYLEYLEENKLITRRGALKETQRLIKKYYQDIVDYIDKREKD